MRLGWVILLAVCIAGCAREPSADGEVREVKQPVACWELGWRNIEWSTAGVNTGACSWHSQKGSLKRNEQLYVLYFYVCDQDEFAYGYLPGGGSGYIRKGALSGC